MPATVRPTLVQASYSPVNTVRTLIVSATLSPINTVTPTTLNVSQHMMLPQRKEWCQTTIESIGANYQWTIDELDLSTKSRGFR